MAMSPLKTPTPTSITTPSPLATVTNGLNTPDLDRSAMSIARDHLSSGSTSAVVSLSGDYKDASGKVIRRYMNVLFSRKIWWEIKNWQFDLKFTSIFVW